MNSEAQRARNKRKRDKLREKRRLQKQSSGTIYRFRLDGSASMYKYRCGLIPPCYGMEFCRAHMGFHHLPGDIHECNPVEWSTEWVFSTTHDLSSSAHDAIQAFINTWRENFVVTTRKIVLIVQVNGRERRKVWQGHTFNPAVVARVVSLCVKRLYSEELLQTPSIVSQ